MRKDAYPIGLAKDLLKRQDSGENIRIGLIGCGEMGTDIVTRTSMMNGIDVAAIADHNPERARIAVSIASDAELTQTAQSTDSLNSVIESGKTGVVNDASYIFESGLIDVVVDATGVPDAGAEIGLAVIESSKHLVMMNVEADVTIGRYLKSEAQRHGVIYSLGAGDEPSSCLELIEFVSAMGHHVVAAGKGKNNPLNIDAVPKDYEQEAKDRNMNPRMLVEFVEGSKTMVEMAAIANATGLIPDVPGMHGPAASRDELCEVLIPKKDGGILSDAGRVDFSVGKGIAPGVFVIVEAEHPRVLERLRDLKLGQGPYFTFIRPYHLTSLEVPLTCARVVLYGKADMQPLDEPVAEVCALAKKNLQPGDRLGMIGEDQYRAWTMEAQQAKNDNAIPCGLLIGASVTEYIGKGELITYNNTFPQQNSSIVKVRQMQDQMI